MTDWDDLEKIKNQDNKAFFVIAVIVLSALIFTVLICANSYAQDYTVDDYVNAIYWAEGGKNARKPFGILSVKCEGYEDCRTICENTVRNNIRRFREYGHKEFNDYLSFLASRYAPVGAGNDPKNLNKNWIKNVKWFLEHPKEIK